MFDAYVSLCTVCNVDKNKSEYTSIPNSPLTCKKIYCKYGYYLSRESNKKDYASLVLLIN